MNRQSTTTGVKKSGISSDVNHGAALPTASTAQTARCCQATAAPNAFCDSQSTQDANIPCAASGSQSVMRQWNSARNGP